MRLPNVFWPALFALPAFMLGRSGAIASAVPHETYYYLPLIVFAMNGAVLAGVLLFDKDSPRCMDVFVPSVTVSILAFCLSFSWTAIVQNALSTRWLMFGSLPTNDANDFLHTALTLLGSGRFETPRGRPLSDAAWAGALALFNLDLSGSVTLYTALAALGVTMACLTARPSIGTASMVFLLCCLFDYVHEHIGGVSSEIPGFVLGLGAFALIVRSAQARCGAAFASGFALLSAAMVYRMGAFFILPALLCWAFRSLGRDGRRPWWTLVGGIVFMAGVFAANGLVVRQVTPTSGGGFVNAIDSWYATVIEGDLALGRRDRKTVLPGTRWVQIYEDFPDLRALHGSEWISRKRHILLDAMADRPLSAMVGGALEIYKYLFRIQVFSFIDFKPLRYLVMILALLGIGICVRRARHEEDLTAGMLLWSNIGILVSQPFLYGGEVRVPAPTVAFTVMLSAFGAKSLFSRAFKCTAALSHSAGAPALLAGGTAAAVLLLSTFGIMQRGGWHIPGEAAGTCGPNEQLAAFSLPKGSGLVLSTDQTLFEHSLPPSTFAKNLARQHSLLETRDRLRSTVFEDPFGPRSSWVLKTVAEDPETPFFAGVILDRLSGKPIQVIIPEPKPHPCVLHYCLRLREDGTLIARKAAIGIPNE